jgi:hypothetical protein
MKRAKDKDKKGSRASEEELGSLHEMFSAYLKEQLANGEVTPSLLNVIRQFLKDNDISCVPTETNTFGGLLAELPKFDTVSDLLMEDEMQRSGNV